MDPDQEKILVERAKSDAEAFGELYDAHYGKIFNYVLRRTADVAVAEDITTDVFIKALDNLQNFTWRGLPFSAWLYRIASHEISNYYRSKHHKNMSLDMLMDEQGFEPLSEADVEAEYSAAEEALTRHHQFLHVQKNLLQLPQKYQQALSLRYFEKKSITEISLIMGKRPGTIKSLLSRGTKKLRDMHVGT